MALNVDTSSPIRSLARYRELATAIYQAPTSTQETQWVEWKSEVDLTDRKWQAELSRQILGFANRDPEVATRWFAGCAYVVIGASPGSLTGTGRHDAATIEAWLSAYVGRAPNAPEWAPTYVEIDGKSILILTIEPPQAGHLIWTCRKDLHPADATPGARLRIRDGAIYVRRKASTEEARSADVEMLSRRLTATRRRISSLTLLTSPSSLAQPIDATEETRAAWIELERASLSLPPDEPEPEQAAESAQGDESAMVPLGATRFGPPPGILKTAQMLAAMSAQLFEPDPRAREQYEAEVAAYLEQAANALPAALMRAAFEKELGRIQLSIRNETDDPIHGVQVELYLPAEGIWAASEYDDVPEVEMPSRPIMLGKMVRSNFPALDGSALSAIRAPWYPSIAPEIRSMGRSIRIEHGSERLTFDPVDLYPQETRVLDEFFLFANPGYAGQTLTGEWTARARDVSGVLRGTIEIPVGDHIPTIDELLAEDEGESG